MISQTRKTNRSEDSATAAEHSEAHSLDVSAVCELVNKLVTQIEKLNKLTEERAPVRTYWHAYRECRDAFPEFESPSANIAPAAQALANLASGLLDYYSPLSYNGQTDSRSLTHTARWPEFKQLLLDGVAELSQQPCTSTADSFRRKKSGEAIAALSYEPSNIARPWNIGEENDPQLQYIEARQRCEIRRFHAECKVVMQISSDLETGSRKFEPRTWKFWGGAELLWAKHKGDGLLGCVEPLITSANFSRESLRPECQEIGEICLQLFDVFLNAAQSTIEASPLAGLRTRLASICSLVQELQPEFAEHLVFQKDFDAELFARKVSPIRDLAQQISADIEKIYGKEAAVEFDSYSQMPEGLIQRLAEIEQSRVGGSNGLKVAYGVEELKELIRRPQTRLIVYYDGAVPVGFGTLEAFSPPLPEALQPILKAASEQRGKLGYGYIPLIAMQKDYHSPSAAEPYLRIISAIDDCAFADGMRITVAWCRSDNRALIKLLSSGFELLDADLTIEEHGVVMQGTAILRLSNPRGLQKLLLPGTWQARKLRAALKQS